MPGRLRPPARSRRNPLGVGRSGCFSQALDHPEPREPREPTCVRVEVRHPGSRLSVWCSSRPEAQRLGSDRHGCRDRSTVPARLESAVAHPASMPLIEIGIEAGLECGSDGEQGRGSGDVPVADDRRDDRAQVEPLPTDIALEVISGTPPRQPSERRRLQMS